MLLRHRAGAGFPGAHGAECAREEVQTQNGAFLKPHLVPVEQRDVGIQRKMLRLPAWRESFEKVGPDTPLLVEPDVPGPAYVPIGVLGEMDGRRLPHGDVDRSGRRAAIRFEIDQLSRGERGDIVRQHGGGCEVEAPSFVGPDRSRRSFATERRDRSMHSLLPHHSRVVG